MARKAKTEAAVAEAEKPSIVSIKGLDADFACKGHKFEVGKTYSVSGKIVACQNGFHAVDASNPFHVWDFYPVIGEDGRLNRYAEVELSGAMDREEEAEGTKIAAAEITVKVELSLPEFIKRAVSALMDMAKGGDTVSSGDSAKLAASGDSAKLAASGYSAQLAASGYYAQLAASGYSAQLAASGDSAQLAASGYYAKLAASGDSAQLAASGYSAKLAASGYSAQLAASGDSAQLAASGDSAKLAASGYSAKLAASGGYAKLAASGDSAKLAASGYSAKLAASGKDSVIAASGPGSIASGVEGTWIALPEYYNGKCIGFATGCIGQDGLRPNTPYHAQGGKLVEVA